MSTTADRLRNRIRSMVAKLTITATDDSGPVHKVQARGFPMELIDNLEVLQIYGLASHAMPGSDATAMFTSGDRSNGVIIATGNQKYRLRGLISGEVALYDNAGNIVKLTGHGIEITCPTKVRVITPRLEVTGDVVADCDGTRISLRDHRHKDTQPGGGNSGVPLPTP
jgi:phage gp45-like